MIRYVRLIWDRLNCIAAWPLLYVIDIGIAWSGVHAWKTARAHTNSEILRVWNRNSKTHRIPC